MGVDNSYIIGGTGVLSQNIEQQVPNPKRIAGNDRYETNFKVLSTFNFDFTYTFFATGTNFPDALSGSALAGQVKAPIVLLSGTEAAQTPVWNNLKSDMKMKFMLGGEGVVPSSTVKQVFARQ